MSVARGRLRFAVLRAVCALLPGDYPRGPVRVWRVWLWLLEARYREAERIGGRDLARHYDYVPF